MNASPLALLVCLGSPPQETDVVDDSEAPAEDAAKDEGAELEPRIEALERDNEALRSQLSTLLEQERERAARREREAAQEEEDEAALRETIETMRREQKTLEAKVERRRARLQLGGYLDTGFFWVGGNGSGVRPDILDPPRYPEHRDVVENQSWVFMGDPLSTAINARGEPADTGPSVALQFDPVRSRGNPTFIVNNLNLSLFAALGESVTVEGLVDFLPRGRDVSRAGGTFLGDYIDAKLIYLRWIVPVQRFDLELVAGKIDSVFGREYRRQEAPDRITVTPSLMCRYTCGRPTGVGSRWVFLPRRALAFNVSFTNGAPMQELFGFSDEIDSNLAKTGTGRLSYEIPAGAGLDIGVSGLIGAQDRQARNDVLHWQYGVDVHLDIRGFELTGEFIQGELQGRTQAGEARCGLTACLRFLSAYGLAGYRITNWLMPFFRTDWRDALHRYGDTFVYVSKVMRFTSGVRFEVGEHVIIKGEYTVNRELGNIPQFPNDVFTSSLVGRF
jgi:hypothetical protein